MLAGPLQSDQKNSRDLACIRPILQLRPRNLALSPFLYPNLVLLFVLGVWNSPLVGVCSHMTHLPPFLSV